MTIVAQLKTPSRRSRAVREAKVAEFREDVLRYGVLLYESLRERRDYEVAKEHDVRKKPYSED